jgi:undecaprenyl-diphosphatase
MEDSARSTWRATALLLATLAVLSVVVDMRALADFDQAMAQWTFNRGSLALDWVMTITTVLMAPELSVALLVLFCLELGRRYGKGAAFWLFGTFFAATLLELILKASVYQPGPHGEFHRFVFREGWIHIRLPYAYPSGHTLRAVFFSGVLAWWLVPRAAAVWWTLGGLIAISRVYLGCHWTTDVLGGALLGLASLMVVRSRIRLRPSQPTL